ncbi:MAG: hypothetical protein JOZ15_11655 [Acidobacteria bacterium]|nr:hypothetical protein [Acidobacteriota bacterium]
MAGRRDRLAGAALLAALLATSAAAADTAPVLTLKFTPQEDAHATSPNIPPALLSAPLAVAFEDARQGVDPKVVGEVVEDEKSGPVRAANDVAAFTKDVFLQVAGEWGLKVAPGSSRVLKVKCIRFFVSQNHKTIGAMFASEARFIFTLTDRGRVLWEGTVSGSAHRYGKRNAENLNEVLSDALKEAYANGVSDPALVAVLSGGGPSGGGSSAGGGGGAAAPAARAEGIAPAQLLSELVDLKKQGFTVDLLVQYVNQKTLSAELSGKDLVAWKQAGMPPAVIKAALARSPGAKQ